MLRVHNILQKLFDFSWVGGQNPNFIETLGLVDAGLGLGFDSFRLNAMRFENHHQRAKQHARQGMGMGINDVHSFHAALVDKAALAQDVTLHTLGRIPPSLSLRQRFPLVDQAIFDARFHARLLKQKHGSRLASEFPAFVADVYAAKR